MLSELNDVLLESPHEILCYYVPTTLIQGGRWKQDEEIYFFRRGPTNLQLILVMKKLLGTLHPQNNIRISLAKILPMFPIEIYQTRKKCREMQLKTSKTLFSNSKISYTFHRVKCPNLDKYKIVKFQRFAHLKINYVR